MLKEELNKYSYWRKQENWFKEILYKLKILKPKYTKLGKVIEIKIESK